VDDDKLICEDIADMLRGSFDVLATCSNGKTALARMEQRQPDLLLTDISMPVMDGVMLIRAVHGSWPKIVVVVLSNYDDLNYVKDAMRCGACEYLLKGVIEAASFSRRILDLYATETGMALPSDSPTDAKRQNMRVEISRTLDFIGENFVEALTLEQMAGMAGFSRSYFCKLFKEETGYNYVEYIHALRIEKAKELLEQGNIKTYEVAEKVGFNDYRYFCRVFSAFTGKKPGNYKYAEKDGKKGP
jgi:YesN/AraC family two-component response regulator